MTIRELWTHIVFPENYIKVGKGLDFKIKFIDGTLFVLFQGSASFWDWIFNLIFCMRTSKPYKNMKDVWTVHTGFHALWNSGRDDVFRILIEYVENFRKAGVSVKTIRAAGWSQGAHMAIEFTEDAVFKFVEHMDERYKNYSFVIKKPILFGCPNGFGRHGAANVKKRVPEAVSFCNEYDWITKLVPEWLGYVNLYPRIQLTRDPNKKWHLWDIVTCHTGYFDANYQYQSIDLY